MSLQTHRRDELIDPEAWLAPTAVVLGDVTIGARSTVWYHAVIRGDSAAITIGDETNIQDVAVLHADPGFPCSLGNRVTVGHGAIVHGAAVEDDCLIGMRAVVMNGARIGAGSIVAVGAVVTEGTVVPPGSLVIGVPGRIRQASGRHAEGIRHAAAHYVEAGRIYRQQANDQRQQT